jgi:hypothetical protein
VLKRITGTLVLLVQQVIAGLYLFGFVNVSSAVYHDLAQQIRALMPLFVLIELAIFAFILFPNPRPKDAPPDKLRVLTDRSIRVLAFVLQLTVGLLLVIGLFFSAGRGLPSFIQPIFLPLLVITEIALLVFVAFPDVLVGHFKTAQGKEIARIAGYIPAYGIVIYAMIAFITGVLW